MSTWRHRILTMYTNLFTPLAVIAFAAVASTAEVPQDTISFTYPAPLVTTTVSEPLVTTTGTAPPVRTTAPPCGYEYDGMVMNAVLKAVGRYANTTDAVCLRRDSSSTTICLGVVLDDKAPVLRPNPKNVYWISGQQSLQYRSCRGAYAILN